MDYLLNMEKRSCPLCRLQGLDANTYTANEVLFSLLHCVLETPHHGYKSHQRLPASACDVYISPLSPRLEEAEVLLSYQRSKDPTRMPMKSKPVVPPEDEEQEDVED